MRFVFDFDGTLALDSGKDYDQPAQRAPLWQLVEYLMDCSQESGAPSNKTYLVTGRDSVQDEVKGFFDEVHCRPFPVEPANTYYARYFQWKVDTIQSLKPDLVFDDDMQICRYLNAHGINAVWTPACAFNGIYKKEEK